MPTHHVRVLNSLQAREEETEVTASEVQYVYIFTLMQ